MNAVPTLDQLAEDPQLARGLSRAVLMDLSTKAVMAHTVILTSLMVADAADAAEEYIDSNAVAALMGVSVFTVRRLAKTTLKRCVVATGTRRLLFSRRMLDETLRQQAGGPARTGGHAS